MAEAQASTTPDGYVHARDTEEYHRLRRQAAIWQGATEALLDRLGLAPGMSCLDVGSGPGLVMRSMANRVGLQGRVTGLEIDGKLGAQSLGDLKAEGGADFSFLEADVLEADPIEGAPFDLTYCRLFLMQMPDPVAVLEKMLAWTKPGGVVAAQEFDFGAIAVEPLCPGHGGVQPPV